MRHPIPLVLPVTTATLLSSLIMPLPEMIVGGMFGGTPLKGKLKTQLRLLGGGVHGGGVEQGAPEVGAGEIGALEVGAF